MTGAVEVDYLELLDAEGAVVGFVDPDGIAHEFPHVEGSPDRYPVEEAREHGKVRTTGDPLILPESALFLLDDDVDATGGGTEPATSAAHADAPGGATDDPAATDQDDGSPGVLLGDDVDALAGDADEE